MAVLNNTQQALARKVLQKLDALDAPGSNIVSDDGTVYEALQEAARQMVLTLPRHLLFHLVTDQRAAANQVLAPGRASNLEVPLPSNFLRLIRFDLQGWGAPLYEYDVTEEVSIDYDQVIRGVAPTSKQPRAFLTYYPNADAISWAGNQALQVYPGDITTATVTLAAGMIDAVEVSVAVEALTSPIGAGAVITFDGPTTITVSADAAAGATSITGTASQPLLAGSSGTYFDGISSFLYVALTAPENIGASLDEPMQWLSAHYIFTAIDPEIAELALVRYRRAMAPRLQHNTRGQRRIYRAF